jgi:hypothetical protein
MLTAAASGEVQRIKNNPAQGGRNHVKQTLYEAGGIGLKLLVCFNRRSLDLV